MLCKSVIKKWSRSCLLALFFCVLSFCGFPRKSLLKYHDFSGSVSLNYCAGRINESAAVKHVVFQDCLTCFEFIARRIIVKDHSVDNFRFNSSNPDFRLIFRFNDYNKPLQKLASFYSFHYELQSNPFFNKFFATNLLWPITSVPLRFQVRLFYLKHAILIKDTAENDKEKINQIIELPSRFLSKANGKISIIRKNLRKKSKKYISEFTKQESNLKKKCFQIDSATSKQVFASSNKNRYWEFLQKLETDSTVVNPKRVSGEYYPYIDSLETTLHYLIKNESVFNPSKVSSSEIASTLRNLLVLQSQMQDADQIKVFILQRREQLKQYLSHLGNLSPGVLKSFNKYKKQFFYYSAQIKEYRESLNDPDKALKMVLNSLRKLPAFNDFVKKNSMLASIFNLNGTYNPSQAGQGLATRDMVLASFQNQIGAPSGPNTSSLSLTTKTLHSSMGAVDVLRSKLSSFQRNGTDLEMPNFKPNDQKTKSFFKRLQFGTDFQTLHSNSYFPTSTDIGLSLGYKMNDKNMVGIGGSFKMGWGKDINHFKITGEGLSVRSFADVHIKKNFYASGGFEYNYQQPFTAESIPGFQDWTRSGLIGITKKTPLRTGLLKNMKLQLLWDFLSHQQIPRTQPLKFRVGYNF